MVTTVSVVVLGSGDEHQLGGLVSSLDAQTLPWSTFELVVVDDQHGPPASRLTTLAQRRPNVRVVAGGDGDTSWLDSCAGAQILVVQAGDLLFPEALEKLTTFATAHALDVLAARVVQSGATPGPLLTADRYHLDRSEVEAVLGSALLGGAALLVQRRLIGADGALRLDDVASVGVLATYPALLRSGPAAAAESATGLRQERGDVRWVGTALEISAAGLFGVTADIPTETDGAAWSAVVRDVTSQLAYLLPCHGQLAAGVDEGSPAWAVSVELDLVTAAAGSPLPAGVWEVDLCVTTSQSAWAPCTLQAELPSAAVLNGLFVVPASSGSGTLRIDVGGTCSPVVVGAAPEDLTVVESAAGSLMTWRLPKVAATGDSTTSGVVALGSFRLPAVLRADADGVRIEAYLSGLAGSSPLSAQFGTVLLKPTGLDIAIAADGEMSAVPSAPRQPAPAPKAKPKPKKKAPTKKALTKKAPAPVAPKPLTRVQHLRRALPASVSPLVDALARQPVARRLYRRAAGLTRR